jgi:hypothetical protein
MVSLLFSAFRGRALMKQKLIFFILTVSAILTADLSITLLNKYIMTHKNRVDPHIMTLIGMGVVFILLYILVSNINRISDWTVRTFVNIGRAYLGRSIGLYISIVLLLVILYAGYYWAWFDKYLHQEIIDFFKSQVIRM